MYNLVSSVPYPTLVSSNRIFLLLPRLSILRPSVSPWSFPSRIFFYGILCARVDLGYAMRAHDCPFLIISSLLGLWKSVSNSQFFFILHYNHLTCPSQAQKNFAVFFSPKLTDLYKPDYMKSHAYRLCILIIRLIGFHINILFIFIGCSLIAIHGEPVSNSIDQQHT